MNGGYRMINFEGVVLGNLSTAITIPNIYNKIKKAINDKKPVIGYNIKYYDTSTSANADMSPCYMNFWKKDNKNYVYTYVNSNGFIVNMYIHDDNTISDQMYT